MTTISDAKSLDALLGYRLSSQQMFQGVYSVGANLPFYFSSLTVGIGLAKFVKGTLVMRFGMPRLTNLAVIGIAGLSLALLPVVLAAGGKPPLLFQRCYLFSTYFCFGALFGILEALSIQALAHIAGVACAIFGSIRLAITMSLGLVTWRAFNGTMRPLVAGFAVLGCIALATTRWAERGVPYEAEVGP